MEDHTGTSVMAVSLQVTVPGLLASEGSILLEPYEVDLEANQVMQLLAGEQSQSKPDPSWEEDVSSFVFTPVSSSRVMLLGGSGIPGRGRLVV